MRNAIFFLAIGIGVAVHFTHRLFPSLTSILPSARLEAPYQPAPEPYQTGPSFQKAVWIEPSPNESVGCLMRRTPSANLEGWEALPGSGTASCQEIEAVPGRYCRF